MLRLARRLRQAEYLWEYACVVFSSAPMVARSLVQLLGGLGHCRTARD